jgi:hypothetical protein
MPTTDTDLDLEVAALLAECKKVGPSEIVPDEAFEPTADERF